MILLSTKILDEELSRKLKRRFDYYEYDAISIVSTPENMPDEIEHAIVTSQNAAAAIGWTGSKIKNAYCVGPKTTAACKNLGADVKVTAPAASILGQMIARDYAHLSFTYLCGNLRLNTLPAKLDAAGVNYNEVTVYETRFNPRGFAKAQNIVLFYSPSGVESFAESNRKASYKHDGSIERIAICIGKTTCNAAEPFFDKVLQSEGTTIEKVVELALSLAPPRD